MAIQNKIISFWKQVKLKSSDMFTQFRVGVGVKVPTHKLHVKDSADPIKIEGLQNDATDPDKFLTIDSSNIVKYRTGAQVLTDIGGTPLTAEQVQDIAGALVATGGTKTNIAVTYDDASGNMDFVVASDLNTTGSAATLTTARAINGVDFDGSAPITITAAGSTLSDTVPVSKGGTGATSFADKAVIITQDSGTDTLAAATMSTNGQLLIGGTDGPAVATLTQGNGLTITNANGGITLAVDSDIDTSGESGTVDNIGSLKGDVTSSNRATTIANDAVTYAKMQNVSATNVVLGRDSAGAGVVEEISAANLRTIINVEDGATADQTQADINGLGITAIGIAGPTNGDVSIVTDGNVSVTLDNDNDESNQYFEVRNSATGVVFLVNENGNVDVGGTVDGRDVAADGTKLDGIESNATADQTKGDIDALGIAATTAVSLTAGDKIIDGNLGLGGDDADSHYITRFTHSDDEGGRLYVQAGAGGGTNKPGGSLLLHGGASTGNANGGSIIFGSSAAGSSGSSVNSIGLLGSINNSGDLSIEGDLTVKGNDIKDDDGTTCITFDSSGNTTVANTLNATLTGDVTGNAATATALTSGDKTIEGNLRLGGTGDTSNNWLSIDAQNGNDSSGGGITFYETGTYDVDSPQYGAKIVYNEDADEFAIGTMHNNVFMRQIYFSRALARTYFNGDLQVRDSSPAITIVDTSTTVANGDVVGTINFSNEDDDGSTLRIQAVATEDHASGANGGTKLEIKTTPNGSSAEEVALTVGEDKSLTVEGTIELGHASDTTLARSAPGIATIEGKQIFTTNTPALTSAAAGVPAVTMQIRRTITTAEANALNSTPIELIPAQGANTVIVLTGGMIRIDRAATQTNSAADMNLHYEGLEPGTFAQTALFHARRFMYNETGDRVFSIIPGMSAYEVAQSLTQDVNKAVEVSVDSALTSNCITSMEFYLTYNVFNIS